MTKSFWVSFVSIFSWSLCFVIAIVWSVVSYNFISGAFNERREYPTSLYFEEIQNYYDANGDLVDFSKYYENDGTYKEMPKVYDSLGNFIDFGEIYNKEGKLLKDKEDLVKRATVLKINGITESDSANVAVDGKIKIGSEPRPQFITRKKVQLTSSNTDVATVPKYANIGEEITVTATKNDKGINNGGYCSITAKTEDGITTTVPIYIFVDIPVSDINLTLEGQNIFEPSEEEKANGIEYVLYVDQVVDVNAICSSSNSVNPSEVAGVQNGFSFINIFKDITEKAPTNSNRFPSSLEKPVEWTNFEVLYDAQGVSGELLDYQDYFQFDKSTNALTTLRASTIKLSARILKTYTDMLFVETYIPSSPGIDNTPSEEELADRFVSDDIVILIKPIILQDMEITSNNIELSLFKTTEITAEQLQPKFLSSRGDYEYFKNLKNEIVISSSNTDYLVVEKILGRNAWNLTVVKESSQAISLNVSITKEEAYFEKSFKNLIINQVGIRELEFNGTAKSDSSSTYNDVIEMQISKSEGLIRKIEIQQNGMWNEVDLEDGWNYLNNCNIVSMQNGVQSTYNVVKVFATGIIDETGTPIEGEYLNQQNEEILTLGMQTNLGRELLGVNSLYSLLPKARGHIYVTAYVIKTDSGNNPIDANGNIINNSDMDKQYVPCIASKIVEIKIIEKLTNMSLMVTSVQADGEEKVQITNTTASVVVLQTGVSSYLFEIISNSFGAMYDAQLSIECYSGGELDNTLEVKIVPGEKHTLGEGIEGDEIVNIYNLKLDVQNLPEMADSREVDVKIKVDGSTLLTVKVVVIRVKVGEIKLTTNLTPDEKPITEPGVEVDDYYTLKGKLNRADNGDITTMWGKEIDGDLKELIINKPVAYPASPELDEGENAIFPRALQLTGANITVDPSNTMLTIGEVQGNSDYLDYKINFVNAGESHEVVIYAKVDDIIESITLKFGIINDLEYSNFNEIYTVTRNTLRNQGVELLNNAFKLDIKTNADESLAQFNATQSSRIWFIIPDSHGKELAIENIFDENNPDHLMSRRLRLTNQASAALNNFDLTIRYTTTDNLYIYTKVKVNIISE